MSQNNKTVEVRYKDRPVGRLALTSDCRAAFQYDAQWLKDGFSISPFSLPLEDRVFVPANYNFDGLFGVFADSLPDSWGRLLLDRFLRSKGTDPSGLNVLDRLSIVGQSGMGALEYFPEYKLNKNESKLSLDELAEECSKILNGIPDADVESLFANGGSSGGARPKAFIKIDSEDWIVKFPFSGDANNSGESEYEYSKLAKSCGIEMTDTKLLPSAKCSGYFATKRFDRPKIHMISAAALLEIDFERSLADYSDLFKLTDILTAGSKPALEQMFLRMCFNVIMHNQDDHLKNFAYLFDEEKHCWKLSPAYDLTEAESGYGQHTTTVNGKGKDVSKEDLIFVGEKAGISKKRCRELADNVIKNCADER